MDEDLKDILTYGFGTLVGYSAVIGLLRSFTKDVNIITIYSLILTIFIWLFYIQKKLPRNKEGGKHDKKRT